MSSTAQGLNRLGVPEQFPFLLREQGRLACGAHLKLESFEAVLGDWIFRGGRGQQCEVHCADVGIIEDPGQTITRIGPWTFGGVFEFIAEPAQDDWWRDFFRCEEETVIFGPVAD